MSAPTEIVPLSALEALPYLDANGQLPEALAGKIGVYAIFDAQQVLQYVGYSRNILLSLKQHLVRQPHACHWVKAHTCDRPSRTALEAIQQAWLAASGSVPPGNGAAAEAWTQPIDVRHHLTPAEAATLAAAVDELAQIKALKKIARRVEADILAQLQARGVQTELRFNPKLKETGLLDLK